jgi:hypothetical protein
MKLNIVFTLLLVFVLAVVASAQTKTSGTAQCGKPELQHSIQVGDRPNHSFAISQSKCTWTKPIEVTGIQGKEGVSTGFAEISGNTSCGRIFYTDTMTNGDKIFYREEITVTLKDGIPQSGDARWTAVGGTGKFKGIKAKGTCKLASAAADGSGIWECEGEYEPPK